MSEPSPKTTAGVVVLYHPDLAGLKRLLRSLEGQVAKLYVIDNTPYSGEQRAQLEESDTLSYIRLGQNMGLAAAQNVGLRLAMKQHFTHVLLLDQDSELSPDTTSGLLAAEEGLLDGGRRVAAVGAMYIDIKTNVPAAAHRYHPFRLAKVRVPVGSAPVESDWLIASGSLLRCDVLRLVGLMREELFIDVVDTEWGLRARSMGYICFLVPAVTMLHSIGDNTADLFGRKLMLHNDLRSCYMVRNNAYLLREPRMGWLWRSNAPLNLLSSLITSTMFAEHRLRRARLLLGALMQGLLGKVGALPRAQ